MSEAERSVVFVEGESDRAALETYAAALGRDLPADGIEIVVLGGITELRKRLVALHDDPAAGRSVVVLHDSGERAVVLSAIARAAVPAVELFECVPDLEHELIRALGTERAITVIAAEGELESFRRLQRQPALRERALVDQLHRFIGSKSGRKLRYAKAFVADLRPDEVPNPLVTAVQRPSRPRT